MDVAKAVDSVVARFIGTKHERDIKKLQPSVAAINAREAEVRALSDEDLKLRFAALKAEIQEELKDADPSEPTYKELLGKRLIPPLFPPSLSCAKQAAASSTCVTSTCSSSAAWSSTTAKSPK